MQVLDSTAMLLHGSAVTSRYQTAGRLWVTTFDFEPRAILCSPVRVGATFRVGAATCIRPESP